jgi:DNA gyrase subunit A
MPGPTGHSITLVKVNEGDTLGWARLTDGKSDVLLATADGMAIRFSEEDVRPMGLVAAGVNGIKLGTRDEVIGMEILPPRGEVLLVASDGKAKRCAAALFPRQGRYGQGVVAWKLPRTATLVGLAVGRPSTRVTLHLTKLAPKAMRLDEAPLQTRAASGKLVVDAKNVQVLGLTIPWEVPHSGGGETRPASQKDEAEEISVKAPASEKEAEQLTFGLETASEALRVKSSSKKVSAVENAAKGKGQKPGMAKFDGVKKPSTRGLKTKAVKPKTRQPKAVKKMEGSAKKGLVGEKETVRQRSKPAKKVSVEKKSPSPVPRRAAASKGKPAGKAAGKIPSRTKVRRPAKK